MSYHNFSCIIHRTKIQYDTTDLHSKYQWLQANIKLAMSKAEVYEKLKTLPTHRQLGMATLIKPFRIYLKKELMSIETKVKTEEEFNRQIHTVIQDAFRG